MKYNFFLMLPKSLFFCSTHLVPFYRKKSTLSDCQLVLPTNANIFPVLIYMFVVNLFQNGFQEYGEGCMNVDLSKHTTAVLQARETHRLTQVIYATDFPINHISWLVASLKANKLKL